METDTSAFTSHRIHDPETCESCVQEAADVARINAGQDVNTADHKSLADCQQHDRPPYPKMPQNVLATDYSWSWLAFTLGAMFGLALAAFVDAILNAVTK